MKSNQKKFLEDISKRLKINSPQDWGKIPVKLVMEHGGYALINKHGGSLFKALQENFPGKELKQEIF